MVRNHSIDTLRTVATILVVLLHTTGKYMKIGMESLNFDENFWLSLSINAFTRVSVPIFVLISGMFLLGRTESLQKSFSRLINRVLIPLIFWTILYISLNILMSISSGNSIDIGAILKSLILGQPTYHLWYLFMLLGLYLITPIINYSIPNISEKTLWKITLALFIFGIFNELYDSLLGNKVLFLLWFVNYLGYYLFGYLIKSYNKKISNYILIPTYLLSCILISIFSVWTIKYNNNIYFFGNLTPLVILGALSLLIFFKQLNLQENYFSKIAYLTFGIYLIHPGVLYAIDFFMKLTNLTTFQNLYIIIPLKFTITFFVSLFIAYVFSKIKILKKVI
ncbi:MAG: acyltransferase family protein [Ignavibacteria bacterium]|nr:acyltransferase family protein [Ignavibacteria bacterium]